MLPQITKLSRKVHLPVEDKDVIVYAYNVGEQRNMLLIKNEGDEQLEEYIIRLIQDKTPDIDVNKLTLVDMIVLFLNITDISAGINETSTYNCSNTLEDGSICNTSFTNTTNMSNYIINGKSENYKIVKINDEISVELKYPSYNDIRTYSKNTVDAESTIRLLTKSINCIYVNEDAINDFREDELYEWCFNLPPKFETEYMSFIESMPTITFEYDVECPNCHNKAHFKNENILDFFIQSTAK